MIEINKYLNVFVSIRNKLFYNTRILKLLFYSVCYKIVRHHWNST